MNCSSVQFNALSVHSTYSRFLPSNMEMQAEDSVFIQNELKDYYGSDAPNLDSFKEVGEKKRLKFNKEILLGEGSFGTRVYLGIFHYEFTNTQQIAAIKHVQYNSEREYHNKYREVYNLQRLRYHENVVKYLFADRIDFINIMCIALELCLGSLIHLFTLKNDVFGRPFKLRVEEPCTNWWFKKSILRGLTEGLSYIHDLHFIHRDLKPQNVLVKEDKSWYGYKAVICDFQFSRRKQPEDSHLTVSGALVGTHGWMPREVLQAEGKIELNSSVDVFAYGCIIQYVLCGNRDKAVLHPYGPNDNREFYIKEGRRNSFVTSSLYSNEEKCYQGHIGDAILADMLIGQCVSSDDKLRPSASDVLQYSPYFWEYDKRMSCCENMYNRLKDQQNSSTIQKNMKSMEKLWKDLNYDFFGHRIPEVWEYFKFFRQSIGKEVRSKNQFSSLFHGLMMIIRNIQQHYYDAIKKYPDLKYVIKDGENKTLGKYFFENIPMSFPVIYLFSRLGLHRDDENVVQEPYLYELHKETLMSLGSEFRFHNYQRNN